MAKAALAATDLNTAGGTPVEDGPGVLLAWAVCRAVLAQAEAAEGWAD